MLGALLALAGCRSNDAPATTSSSTGPKRGGALVASIRSEPTTYNRYLPHGAGAATEAVTLLTQARLARVNRVTDALEPWLAEGWTLAGDGVTYTVRLREGITFSDGQPLTSDDVLFSFRVAYDPKVASPLASRRK